MNASIQRKSIVWSLLAAALLLSGLAAGLPAEETDEKQLTADEVVDKANFVAYYQGADGRARVKMTIVDEQGRTRNREMTILRRDERKEGSDTPAEDQSYTGEQKFYIYFYRPADVNKMSYLVHKHLDKDDDRWLYVPGLDLIKRIAGTEKRTSFVGSDFYYEDISGRDVDADEHELVEVNDTYYVLKNTPKKPGEVEFAYYKNWIHKDTFLVVRTTYYDENDKAYRQYEAKKVEQIDGNWTTTASRMSDLENGRHTDLEYSKVEYNVGLPEDIFTERYLRRPPVKYLPQK